MDIRKIRGIGQEKRKGPEPKEPDPTPEEIAAKCKEISDEWSEDEKARRRGMSKTDGDRWNVPTVRESGSEGDE